MPTSTALIPAEKSVEDKTILKADSKMDTYVIEGGKADGIRRTSYP
jgi:hypothetical protein